jgi:hypothetical protein
VAEIRDLKLQNEAPFLSFLSACSTGANHVKNLADEGIHLVNACQLAGSRHVIGTLWEVSDAHCVEITKCFYEVLRDEGFTDEAVSLGLHKALRQLHDIDLEAAKWREPLDELDDSLSTPSDLKRQVKAMKGREGQGKHAKRETTRKNCLYTGFLMFILGYDQYWNNRFAFEPVIIPRNLLFSLVWFM